MAVLLYGTYAWFAQSPQGASQGEASELGCRGSSSAEGQDPSKVTQQPPAAGARLPLFPWTCLPFLTGPWWEGGSVFPGEDQEGSPLLLD